MRKSKILLVALVASVVLLAAPAAADVSISVDSQVTEGDNVTVDSVEIDEEGWVAVYPESVDGGPDYDDPLGAAQLIEGSNPGVVVDVEGLDDHGFYHAVLHYDESDEEEFDYPDDPVVTDEDDNEVRDDFFVAVGTHEILDSYASANDQKRALENQIADLRDEIDELEDDEDEYADEIADLEAEIDSLEDDLEDIQDTISETEDLLAQLDDDEVADVDDDDEEADEADDEDDDEEDDDDEEEPEGLPGFTAVAALVASFVAALFLLRRD